MRLEKYVYVQLSKHRRTKIAKMAAMKNTIFFILNGFTVSIIDT